MQNGPAIGGIGEENIERVYQGHLPLQADRNFKGEGRCLLLAWAVRFYDTALVEQVNCIANGIQVGSIISQDENRGLFIRYPADQRDKKRPMGWEYRAYSRPIYDGDLDYRKIVTLLRKAGYANDLCLENESLHHFPPAEQLTVLKREIAMLRKLA